LLWVIAGCTVFQGNENRDNLSVLEAQSLVPFTICLPTYLPEDTESTPRISYYADIGAREEARVRLRYYRSDNQELAFEVKQANSPNLSQQVIRDTQDVFILDLLRWLENETGRKAIESQVVTGVTAYQEHALAYELFEVREPVGTRANMVIWMRKSVLYQIYSRLPPDEIKRISRSIPTCANSSASTPAR